jgi:hypothetical protein
MESRWELSVEIQVTWEGLEVQINWEVERLELSNF